MKVNASGGIDGSDALMGPKVQANDIKQAAEQFEAIFYATCSKRCAKPTSCLIRKITRLTAIRCA